MGVHWPRLMLRMSAGHFSKTLALIAKAGDVPDAPALQAHEQGRHPVIGALAHGAASDGHGPVDLPIALQLVEEDRHELRDRLHGDLALHGHHRRNAGFAGRRRPRR